MTGSKNDRSNKLKALFENKLFVGELAKVKKLPNDDGEWDIEVIKLRARWGLVWEYHVTLIHFMQTGEVDYGLGDKDIRVVNYRAQELQPSEHPKDEFRVMQSLSGDKERGVYLKMPKELTQSELKDFVSKHFDLIEAALDNNYPGRLKHQAPEQQTKRKLNIYRMHDEDVPMQKICDENNCEPRYVRLVVKEYKDKINS